MSCISEFAKYVLFIFNFLVSICALALIVFGIIYYMKEDTGVNVFSDILGSFSLGLLSVGVGVIILFISAFGCCGTLHENTCLLTTYAVLLVILFALQMVFGLFFVVKITNKEDFDKFVKDLIQDFFDDKSSSRIESFHAFQTEFECCGVNGPSDYNISSTGWPASCCANGKSPCFTTYDEGCAEAFTQAMTVYIEIIGYVAIGFAVLELAGAVFSFLLRRENLENKLKFENKLEETSI